MSMNTHKTTTTTMVIQNKNLLVNTGKGALAMESARAFNTDKIDQPVNVFFHRVCGAITIIDRTLEGSDITQQQGIDFLLDLLALLITLWRPSGWKIHLRLVTTYLYSILKDLVNGKWETRPSIMFLLYWFNWYFWTQ